MAKLILSFENTVLKALPLTQERVTIGRRADNDIQVDNLAVSGLHAVVTTIANDSVLEDMNSTNGTTVNGQTVQKHLLQNHDVIELGKHKIKYVIEMPTGQPYVEFEKTMVMRRPVVTAPGAAGASASPGAHAPAPPLAPTSVKHQNTTITPAFGAAAVPPAAAPAAPPAPPVAAAAPVREAAIQVLSGGAAGRVLDLTKNLTTIGKAGSQVAVITRRPNGFFVTHVEGPAFPLVNGVALGTQAQLLQDGDTIEISGIKMNFFYK